VQHSKILYRCNLPDEAATLAFGQRLSTLLKQGNCVLFHGDLGMGKTTLIRGLLAGAAQDHGLTALDVPSPTFTLVQIYPFPDVIYYHYDLYRLPEENNEGALTEIGFDESLNDGIVLVEWPERLGQATPSDALIVTLAPGQNDGARECHLSGDARWISRLNALEK
jgi:tRNA threonylcarbamoyl adenosine modification protein YjeE